MIKEQGFDHHLQAVDDVIVSLDVGQLVRQDRLELLRREARARLGRQQDDRLEPADDRRDLGQSRLQQSDRPRLIRSRPARSSSRAVDPRRPVGLRRASTVRSRTSPPAAASRAGRRPASQPATTQARCPSSQPRASAQTLRTAIRPRRHACPRLRPVRRDARASDRLTGEAARVRRCMACVRLSGCGDRPVSTILGSLADRS